MEQSSAAGAHDGPSTPSRPVRRPRRLLPSRTAKRQPQRASKATTPTSNVARVTRKMANSITAIFSSSKPMSEAAQAAATAVLVIPELLAQILACMDMQTLLLAQRVSRTWHAVITETPALQERLFFNAVLADKPEDVTDLSIRSINPLLSNKFPTFFPPHQVHPPVTHYDLRHMHIDDPPFGFMDGKLATKKSREVFLRKGASWRRMLVQQPACMKLGFIEHSGVAEQSYRKALVDCQPSQGLRMGQLYDLVYQFAGTGRRERARHDFTVYRRVPDLDPPVNAYSYRYGGEEIALSKFEPDVGFVILRNAAGRNYYSVNDIGRRSQLPPDYLPKEWTPCSLELEFTSAQDWFG